MSEKTDRLEALPLRPALHGKTPYGAPQMAARVALNVNENTHPLPAHVKADILARIEHAVNGLNRYPDRDAIALREALAEYLNTALRASRGPGSAGNAVDLSVENVWAANGSNEILQQLLQAFGGPGRSLLSFDPTYSMYPLLALGTDTQYIGVPRRPDFSVDLDAARGVIEDVRPTVTVLCTPNNPTGTATSLADIEELYEVVSGVNGILVVDEAYAEFARDNNVSAVSLLTGRERLVVSRTMSKAFGLAGARLGYLAAHPSIVDALQLVRLPYHLSALTQATAEAALAHSDSLLATVDDIRHQRDRIVEGLRGLGYTVPETDTNFVLFCGVEDPDWTWDRLVERSILIRKSPLPHSLRVSAGTEAETSEFLAAMRALRAQGDGDVTRSATSNLNTMTDALSQQSKQQAEGTA